MSQDSINPSMLMRIAEDVKQALINWADVPEHVDFRYSEAPNGLVIVSEYDDAMPGQVQARYELHVTVREI